MDCTSTSYKMANQIIHQSLSSHRSLATSRAILAVAIASCYLLVLVTPPAVAAAATVAAAADTSASVVGGGSGKSEVVTLQEQVKLLSKQLTALTTRRREDYQLLENNLKKYILESAREFSDIDIQSELRNLK